MYVKVEWMPLMMITNPAASYYSEATMVNIVGTTADRTTTDDVLRSLPGFCNFNPARSFKKFIKVHKYYKGLNEGWVPISTAISEAGTAVRIKAAGYIASGVMGQVHATYYFRLKGQQV